MEYLSTADGTNIAWDSVGSGPAVVLVHGITESSQGWTPIVQRLADTNRVVTLDLRGHGQSGSASTYDIRSLAEDVVAVASAAELEDPHLVGHSLGGVVVSAAGALLTPATIVNVDQPLALAELKALLMTFEPQLRDAEMFPAVMAGLFDQLYGTMISPDERTRVDALRRPDQEVVLGIWDLMLSQPEEAVASAVDEMLAPYSASSAPYLSLFGMHPGPDYGAWLVHRVPNAVIEVWDDHGHYPHLVNPDRFVDRLRSFWG